MSTVPFIDLAAVHEPIRPQLTAVFDDVLRRSAFTGGAEVSSFEEELARYVGASHAVGVGSGTAALHLALVAAGVGPGDEVILPANTFIATAEAVVAAGATPVLAEVEATTALLDPASVEAAVTARTAAVIAVHLYGQPVDGRAFRELAAREGLFLLEDACQAIGASWEGIPAGSLGDAAAFSFYPGKNLGAFGDAGAVTTHDQDLARRVRRLRSHGEASKHQHLEFGVCERLDGLQAALLRVKLRRLPAEQRRREVAVAGYTGALDGMDGVTRLRTSPGARHVHHLLVVRVAARDTVLGHLRRSGVEAAVHYPRPIHLQPAGGSLGARGQFPVAEALSDSVLSLPLWPGMGAAVVDRVVGALEEAVRAVATYDIADVEVAL
jgi:dTDP-4-amino-4,6-dideoxygalactose transaminase